MPTKNPPNRKSVSELSALWQEIEICEQKIRLEVVPVMTESLMAYTGQRISADNQDCDVVLNDVFPIIQQKLPYLFFRKPRALIKPRRKNVFVRKRNPVTGELQNKRVDGTKLAKTTEAAINWDLHESGFEEEMDKVSLDLALYPYSYLWQSYNADFGLREDETMFIKNERIFQKRIRPDLFLWDTSGSDEGEWQWIGRKVLVRLTDVLDDPRYRKQAKDSLEGVPGFGDKTPKTAHGADSSTIGSTGTYADFLSDDFKQSIQSKRIWLYEIWKKASLKERLAGKRGKVYVLSRESGTEPLFESDDWPLKQEGFPGELFKINPLNDKVPGLADPLTYLPLIDEKQTETNYILDLLKKSSNFSLVLNSTKFSDEEAVRKFESGETKILMSNSNLDPGDVTSVTPGSVPAAAFQVLQNTNAQLEKQSTVTSTRLGIKPPGEMTATQAEILEKGLQSRPTIQQKLIGRTLTKLARKRIQLLKQFKKKKDIVPILGTFDIEWSDEFSNADITDEVDVTIDIQSMLPENPAVEIANLMKMMELMFQALANPSIYQKILQEGKTFNFSPFIEQILLRMNLRDEEMFRPVRPEEGEGFTPNAVLMEAQRETITAIVQGQVEPPQLGELHDVHLVIHESILQLLIAMGQRAPALEQHIAQTKQLQLEEEQSSGKRKPGETNPPQIKLSGEPQLSTRASQAARAQGRNQVV